MVTDPEELLRSIERTREEVAHTVDTIAARLDPKKAAQRGAASVRGRLTGAGEATRSKLSGPKPSWSDTVSKAAPYARKVPKPALGAGLAALVALAAILASRRKR
jgi:hypothetical protein